MLATASAGANPEPWQWLAPRPQGNPLHTAATDGKTLVAVGDKGAILIKSAGSAKWEIVDTSALIPTNALYGAGAEIVWTGRRFLIAGRFREGLLVSDNGRDWALIPQTARLGVVDFARDNAVPLAQVGDTTVGILVFTTFLPGERVPFIRSTDHGETWVQGWLPQPPKSSKTSNASYATLISHKNLFVAAGSNGMIATSEDGLGWTRRAAGLTSNEVQYLASNGQTVVASAYDDESGDSYLLHSPDGVNWGKVEMQPIRKALQEEFGDGYHTTSYIDGIFADGPRLIADIGGRFFASVDGKSWSRLNLDISTYQTTWLGRLAGETYILNDRGGIGRIGQDGASYVEEVAQNSLSGYGMSTAGLGLESGSVDVIVSVSGYSSSYAVSISGADFVERDFGNNLRPIAVARIGDRLVVAAKPTVDQGSKETNFYQSSNGLEWVRMGAGLFDGENLQLVGASVNSGPLLLSTTQTDYDSNTGASTTNVRLYRSAQGLDDWQLLAVPGASKPPAIPHPSLETDIQWDGQRFILRNASGELWHSTDGTSWLRLPSLPDDTRNFLLATVWSPETVEKSDGQLQKNYASYFASNGNRLVVRPAKLVPPSDHSSSMEEAENSWWWDQWGPDIFFVYDFTDGSTGWRRVLARPLGSYPIGYAEVVWTGNDFVAATDAGRISTSPDGMQWTSREVRADVENLHWTGSRLVATNWRGSILTHPTGLSRELAEPKDSWAASGLGLFMTTFEGGFQLYEIVEGEALVDEAILLRDKRNRALNFTRLARLVGGLMDFYFADEPLPVPLSGAPEVAVERKGRVATLMIPDFNLRTGTFRGIRRLQVNLDSGIVKRLRSLTPRRVREILEYERKLGADLNGDGVIGDGVTRPLGANLYATASGAVYYHDKPLEVGHAVPPEAVLLTNVRGKPLSSTSLTRGFTLMEQKGGLPGVHVSGDILRIAIPNYTLPRGGNTPVFASLTLYSFALEEGRARMTARPRKLRSVRHQALIWETELLMGLDLNGDNVLGARIYVKASAEGENTGQSWQDALTDLQDALDLAAPGMEIWLAGGTYKPSRLPQIASLLGITNSPKLCMFELKSGVALYGGFAGGETNLNQRDIDENPTILSGDHLGNDEWPPTLENQTLFHDNVYSVVLAYQLRPAARLDGLIITGGNAYALSERELFPSAAQSLPPGDDNRSGGGIIALSSDLIIANCTLKRNMALNGGGGLGAFAGKLPLRSQSGKLIWSKARPGSRLTVTDTLFEENLVPDYSFTQLVYGSGGAVFIADNYVAEFRNVEFLGNSASNGGAVNLVRGYGSPRSQAAPIARFVNCVFYKNTAICSPSPAAIDPLKYDGMVYLEDGAGGALYADGGARFDIARCLFLENSAVNVHGYIAPSGLEGGYGGAIALDATSKGRIATTVFSRNTGEQNGGAINVANWDGYPRGTALEVYFSTFHANNGTYTAGISHYGSAVVRGYANIFYENVNSFGSVADLGNFPPSASFFSNSLFTAGGDLSGNVGTGNIFRNTGASIFVDPSNPAGPDGQWGTSDDGYRLRPGVLTTITQVPPPDFADVDGNGKFREPLPIDAKGDNFGLGPFNLGAYQRP